VDRHSVNPISSLISPKPFSEIFSVNNRGHNGYFVCLWLDTIPELWGKVKPYDYIPESISRGNP
jgi:hypothetical protein